MQINIALTMPDISLDSLLTEIRACRQCESTLPLGPRPILRAQTSARLLIVGQAPGTRVHETGIPWNDPSGSRLRDWLKLDRDTFYDESRIAIVPMGFCYPGKGRSGDLPPRPECQASWHPRLLPLLNKVELILLVGSYAQAYYLGSRRKATLTETVKAWHDYEPTFIPLPHPSPRNQLWLKRNPWFEAELVPVLQAKIRALLQDETKAESAR